MPPQAEGYGPPTPVPIFQWEQEFNELLDLYRKLKPKRVLEIGTYHGGTLYHWLTNARKGAKVATVDSYAAGVDNRHLYNDWVPDGDAYLPLAQKGAAVVFHDILPPSIIHPEIEVARLWAEIKADGYDTEEIVADPDAAWGGIGIVRLP
jgi:predicted O-methyltransferase YrrM